MISRTRTTVHVMLEDADERPLEWWIDGDFHGERASLTVLVPDGELFVTAHPKALIATFAGIASELCERYPLHAPSAS